MKDARRFPELSTIDLAYILEKNKTETKIINYMLDKILANGARHREIDSHLVIMPIFIEKVDKNLEKNK